MADCTTGGKLIDSLPAKTTLTQDALLVVQEAGDDFLSKIKLSDLEATLAKPENWASMILANPPVTVEITTIASVLILFDQGTSGDLAETFASSSKIVMSDEVASSREYRIAFDGMFAYDFAAGEDVKASVVVNDGPTNLKCTFSTPDLQAGNATLSFSGILTLEPSDVVELKFNTAVATQSVDFTSATLTLTPIGNK